jgi:hypothetical protein
MAGGENGLTGDRVIGGASADHEHPAALGGRWLSSGGQASSRQSGS